LTDRIGQIVIALAARIKILAPPLVIGENALQSALDIMDCLLGELNWL